MEAFLDCIDSDGEKSCNRVCINDQLYWCEPADSLERDEVAAQDLCTPEDELELVQFDPAAENRWWCSEEWMNVKARMDNTLEPQWEGVGSAPGTAEGKDVAQLMYHSQKQATVRPIHRQLPGAEIAMGLVLAISAVSKSLASPKIHHIQEGQTLNCLAEHFFGDELLGWLIADLNADCLRRETFGQTTVIEILIGTPLTLPRWDQIRNFYHSSAIHQASDLVTVVTDRAHAREALQSMALVMGYRGKADTSLAELGLILETLCH